MLFNRMKKDELEGDLMRFDATYEGDGEKVNWPGERSLFLKKECKVMLLWNKSEDLKNGSMGTFKKMAEGNKLLVYFEKVGIVAIERVTWFQRNHQGETIGAVHQFPLTPGYAVTCHKSQGLELPAVVVHCSKEFVPGLVYVSMSRVRSATTLQVIGFNRTQVIPADHEVIMQCSRVTGEHSADLRCCRRKVTRDESFFDVQDRYRFAVGDSADAEDCYEFPVEVSDGKVQSYFEREDTDLEVSVAQLFEQMEKHESELSHPPSEGLDATPLLIKLKVNTPFSEFSRAINENVDLLLEERFTENVKTFIDIMWFHSFVAIENHIIENPDDLDIKVTRSDFTTATGKLHQVFNSEEFSRHVSSLFNVSPCITAQRSIGVDLGMAVYFKFLEHLVQLSRKEYQQEVVAFNVDDMSAAGRAKVRHVGGWAVRKVLEKSRRYVRVNISSENSETMASVRRHHSICELIEESLVGSVAVLEEESQHKDTLQVTEARQYRERGLIHIEDAVYKFFMYLEKQRVHLLNDHMLRREGANMVEEAHRKLIQDDEISLKWQQCFKSEDVKEKKVQIIVKQSIHLEFCYL